MISSQLVPLLAILASSLTLTCLSLIKSTLYPNLVIFIPVHPSNSSSSSSLYSYSSCKFTCLQQTWLLQFTLLWHLTNKSQQTSTHSKFFGTCHYKYSEILQNINTSHQHSKNYTGFLSNKESTIKPVFSHTKHLQINNLHIFTIVFHSRHILFLHDLLIHLFFPYPYVRSSLGKRTFSVIGQRLWNSLPPDTRNSSSLPIFRSRLKTHLFKIAFPP